MGLRTAQVWAQMAPADVPSSLVLATDQLADFAETTCVADFGCGTGAQLRLLREVTGAPRLLGIDINNSALREGGRRGLGRTEWVQADVTALPLTENALDGGLAVAFLTTLVDRGEQEAAMREMHRVLRPGSLLRILDLSRNDDLPLYRDRYHRGREQGHLDGTFEVVDSRGQVTYLAHHYSAAELELLVKDAGFEVASVSQPRVTTRSGNSVRGLLVSARA
jgi:ubiquinone/menaquinone biosynthesis C-methylase UbiE